MLRELLDVVLAYAPWLVSASVLGLLVGAVLAPAMILRMPPDYFLPERRNAMSRRVRHPAVALMLTAAKNGLGALLLLVGFALLFLPGQGLLTLLAGLVIMNYPGKYRLERWIVTRPRVLSALNWLRLRYGREPLKAP